MDLKEPDYVILMMTTYRTLENFEGSDMKRRFKGSGRKLVTKWFNYCGVFGNHFHYCHQVDNNNNFHNFPIFV